ncbi:MAG: hypothetical protein AVDCRST_MAG25-3683, partial [uncultured Rubrobacteraceae bacterium]
APTGIRRGLRGRPQGDAGEGVRLLPGPRRQLVHGRDLYQVLVPGHHRAHNRLRGAAGTRRHPARCPGRL